MTLSVWTTQQIINQLDSGAYWSGQSTITYDFATATTWLTGSTELSQFVPLNAAQQNMATLAITLWGDLIPQALQKITPTATNTGNIDIAAFNGPSSDYAHTYFPSAGTVWFNDYYNGTTGGATNNLVAPTIGLHGFATYIHELGHAFGLNHSGNYNAGSGTPEPTHYEDSTVYSIMSYFGPSFGDGTDVNTGQKYSAEIAWGNWLGYDAQTPMLDDILAIQTAYGTSTTTRTGDTVYGFHSNVTGPEAALYDFAQNAHPVMCIFNSSGNDTLDLSGDFHNNTIDLHSGAFSSVMGMTNNLSIAYSCTIENAVGGSGADNITGNDAGNTLSGGAGNDHIYGGAGNDTLSGDAGADFLNGGAGVNTLSYYGSAAAVSVVLATGAVSGGDATGDTVLNFQNVIGSNAGGDFIVGDSGDNTIWGNGGDDLIGGGAGNDHIYGGDGNDTIGGDSGADYLDGGAGVNTLNYYWSAGAVSIVLATGAASGGDATGDTILNFQNVIGSNAGGDFIVGDSGDNTIWGNGGDDLIGGGAGNDHIYGGDGNDTIGGDSGADYLDGGAGVNTLNYYWSAGAVSIVLATGAASGGDATGDTILNFQNVIGSNAGGDFIVGDSGDNTIWGNGGDDLIGGGAGNDHIYGGDGNDTIGGDSGADYLDGGAGVNTLNYYWSAGAVSIVLATGAASGGDATGDTILNFQNVIGSNAGGDFIVGDSGDNTIWGNGGNDTIDGGAGNDHLFGGAGNDTFVYSAAGFGQDEIGDFTSGQDHIKIATQLAKSISDLTIVQSGSAAMIEIGTDTILLDGIQAAALKASDFIFF